MKKILFIILLIPLLLLAQPHQSPAGINSSYTALSSGATFTGVWEQIRLDYSWIIVTVKSNVASANSGVKVFQSRDGKTFNSVNIFSYAANDTTTNKYFVPITSGYVKVTYLNGATNQTTFSLTTVYQKGAILPTTYAGKLDVNVDGSALPTGASTSANQTNGTQTTMITGSPNNYATWFSTVGTVKDSVQFGFTTRSVTFINDGVLTDTLFVSTSNSFPSTNTIKRLGGEGFTKQWATTKLYFKVGTTPLASKKIRIEAN